MRWIDRGTGAVGQLGLGVPAAHGELVGQHEQVERRVVGGERDHSGQLAGRSAAAAPATAATAAESSPTASAVTDASRR